MALVATSLDGPASTYINSLSETDTQDRCILPTNFSKQFDSATIIFEAQAEAKKINMTARK